MLNREAAESLFRNGRLTPSSDISFLEESGGRVSLPACEVPFLGDLFEIPSDSKEVAAQPEGAASEPDSARARARSLQTPRPRRRSSAKGASTSSPPISPTLSWAEAVPDTRLEAHPAPSKPEPASGKAEPASPRAEPAHAPAESRSEAESSGKAFVLAIVASLVLLLMIGRCEYDAGEVPIEAPPPIEDLGLDAVNEAEPAVNETNAPERAPVSADEISSSITRYVIRETNIRLQPSATGPPVTRLARGAAVSGVLVSGRDPQHQWMKVTAGPHAGYFVAQSNLSAQPRPELDTSFAGQMTVMSGSPIYSEPSSWSARLDMASRGLSVRVLGATESGMAELSLRSGGIGYIDIAALLAQPRSDVPPGDSRPFVPERQIRPPPPPATPTPQADKPPWEQVQPPFRASSLNSFPVSGDDYPSASLRAREEGRVGFVATITPDGRAASCTVTRSSGFRRLDRATCRLFRSRARFDPAIGSDGKPVSARYEGSVMWRLPTQD